MSPSRQRGFGRLPGQDRRTIRAVRRAIRDGGTNDPRVNALARQVVRSTPRWRWPRYFYALMLAIALARLAFTARMLIEVALQVAFVALFVGLLVSIEVHNRRLANYRGLPASPSR